VIVVLSGYIIILKTDTKTVVTILAAVVICIFTCYVIVPHVIMKL